jgi:invasion protein IalB
MLARTLSCPRLTTRWEPRRASPTRPWRNWRGCAVPQFNTIARGSADTGSVRGARIKLTFTRHTLSGRCAPSDNGRTEQCAAVQTITSEDRPNVGLTVTFLLSTDKKLLLQVLAPLGVLMPSGLGLKIDDKDIGRVGFTRCTDSGCVAEVIVDDNLLASFKRGKLATFIIFQASEEGIGVPVSLVGFAESIADLSH